MGKLKKILSPDEIRLGERIEKTRAETAARLQEEIDREKSLLKPDGSVDVSNSQAQAGRKLSRSELVRKIRKLNPSLFYEQSVRYPAQGGLYIHDPINGKRFLVGFPHDTVGEFDVRLTKPKVIPDPTVAMHWQKIEAVDGRIPGWRTVLLRLLHEGLLSPSGIDREFQITRGRSSQKWQEAVN